MEDITPFANPATSGAAGSTGAAMTGSDANRQRFGHIVGWGADLDRANRPGVPMERTPPRLPHLTGEPSQQQSDVEVLHSNERDGITPIFGTPQPPKGLSGMLRRVAFRFSENDIRHWLVLLMADRVNTGEGLIEDLARGHVPNLYAEMGGPAEVQHNPRGAAKKAAIGAGLVVLVLYLSRRRAHGSRYGD